jgi:S1-C subfamily serine protease
MSDTPDNPQEITPALPSSPISGQAPMEDDQEPAAAVATEERPAGTVEMPAAPPQPVSQSSASPRRFPAWLIALLAVVVIAVSSGVTYMLATADQGEPAAPAAEGNPNGQPSAAEVVPGEEPVADVADLILPSVVQIQTDSGVGSGVIYDSNGLILTAAHVVAGSQTVTVRFNDGEQTEGTVVGGTSGADVAVVKVDRTGLPAATLALDDELRVGQMAVAVGSPWGLQGTVTAGIISAINQSVPSGTTARSLIQTDAAINPGNSGGPLVDREGRVIGINVSIFSLSGANDGVGFAVPIDVAHDIAQRVVNGESIESAFLGVMGEDATSGQAGAVITDVTQGTAADKAGIVPGDLVTAVDGVGVQGMADLAAQVQAHQPGDTVEIVVVRNGQETTLTVTFGTRPEGLG